jgi:hypothetical protein
MATANLALRFVVELAGLASLAYWGSAQAQFGVGRVALAIAAPLALALVWAFLVAPNTTNGLSQPQPRSRPPVSGLLRSPSRQSSC